MLELNKIYVGDCLDLLRDIPDKSIDLVLTDPPYGCGKADWDLEFPTKMFEKHYFNSPLPTLKLPLSILRWNCSSQATNKNMKIHIITHTHFGKFGKVICFPFN